MEYRFSLTPRLIALTLFCGISLLILLFTLGFQVGQMMGGGAQKQKAGPAGYIASAKADAAAAGKTATAIATEMTSAAKPVAETAAWTPKAAP